MNEHYLYWDDYRHEFYDPRNNGLRVYELNLPRLDRNRIRLAVTKCRATIDPATGIPIAAYRKNITDQTTALFVIKTVANWMAEEEGDIDYSTPGFDSDDSAWHHVANCCITFAPVVIPLTVDSDLYPCGPVLFQSAIRWTLEPADPLWVNVLRDVYTGSEDTAPSGTPGSIGDDFSITDSNTYVDVDVEDATAETRLSISYLSPTGDPGGFSITQIPLAGGADTVRLSSGIAPGTGNAFNGYWQLERLRA